MSFALLGLGPAILTGMAAQAARSARAIAAARDWKLAALTAALAAATAVAVDASVTVELHGKTYHISPVEVKAIVTLAQINALAQLAQPRRAKLVERVRRLLGRLKR